ncbi:putative nAD(P)H-dependent quinone reductase [Streptococcus intermedius BA1]|nr:putative nAD(P)H-dependent quinone reductase [Streptococcus intermedius]EKU16338.1 putative nAD(P)H-dependent quinone reductase [Streptococcus intermedius BA1]
MVNLFVADIYGQGGLMKEKEYILSTTWNAPEEAFNNSTAFFNGKMWMIF